MKIIEQVACAYDGALGEYAQWVFRKISKDQIFTNPQKVSNYTVHDFTNIDTSIFNRGEFTLKSIETPADYFS